MYFIGKEEEQAVLEVLRSKQLFRYNLDPSDTTHLNKTNEFEESFSNFIGTKYCLAVSSGTAALISALAALEVGPGDEVIIPAYTFIANAHAILAVGAIPIIAEIDSTLTLDPVDVQKKITKRTRAVIAVHMVGQPCNLSAIRRIAKSNQIHLVEDSCQSTGGFYKGKPLGSYGDLGCFSFNYFKAMTCGEGGAIVTNNRTLLERATAYHDPGYLFREHKNKRIESFAGHNYRINEISSAILSSQLKRLPVWIEKLMNSRDFLYGELQEKLKLVPIPSNDPKGGASSHVFFKFSTEDEAMNFLMATYTAGVSAFRPFDSNRHIFIHWDHILKRRGAHTSRSNPYRNKSFPTDVKYTKRMCQSSQSILKRTVGIPIHPDWNQASLKKMVKSLYEHYCQ